MCGDVTGYNGDGARGFSEFLISGELLYLVLLLTLFCVLSTHPPTLKATSLEIKEYHLCNKEAKTAQEMVYL